MTDSGICAQCGTRIPGQGVQGLCPACLARMAFTAEGAATPNPGPAPPRGTNLHYFGDYELMEEIARGGMGVVYRARQVSLNRVVAVKLLLSGRFASAEFVRRFRTEAEAAASLQHPHIVAIHEIGEHEGQHYFSMDYVPGQSLAEVLRRGPMETPQAVECLKAIAEAIHYAHQRGILHRDLKPANILIDAKGQPRVTDFGLARLLEQPDHLTRTEAVMGTPSYMPPEQAAGRAKQLTTSADVYALGALFYHMLLGQPPFQGASTAETLRLVLETEPRRPRSVQPRLEPDLERICLKCLEKDPQRRYGSAEALAEDLGRWLRHEPVTAAGPGALYIFQKFVRRHRGALATAAGMVLLLVAGTVVSTWQAVRATRAEDRALTQAGRSDQVARFLKDMLEGVGPSVARGEDTKMLRGILDRTAERAGKELSHQPLVELELRQTLASVYVQLGLFDQMEQMARKSLEIARASVGGESLEAARALVQLGAALRYQGKLPEADASLSGALSLFKKLAPGGNPDFADGLKARALLLRDRGRLAEAEALLRETLAMQKRVLASEHVEVADSLNQLGAVLREENKLAEAETVLREALAMERKLLGETHTDVANSLVSLAQVLYTQGKLQDAEATQRQALAMQQKLFPHDHPEIANSLYTLAAVLYGQGRPADAEPIVREALAMQRKLFGNDQHRENANSLNLLAMVLLGQDKLAEAETAERQAIAAQRQILGEESPDLGNFLNTLAKLLLLKGEFAQAEAAAREALELQKKLLGPEHPLLANPLRTLAAALGKQGQLVQAETLSRQAVDLVRKALGAQHPSVADGLSTLGDVLRQQKKLAEAETTEQEALALYRKVYGSGHRFVTATLNDLAAVLAEQEKLPEAEVALRELMATKPREQKLSPAAKTQIVDTINRLVRYHDRANRPDQAAEWKQHLAELD